MAMNSSDAKRKKNGEGSDRHRLSKKERPACSNKRKNLTHTSKATSYVASRPVQLQEHSAVVESILRAALTVGVGEKQVNNVLDQKLRNKYLMLYNPHKKKATTHKTDQNDTRQERISRRQMKAKGFKINRANARFSDYLALHAQWKEYATKTLLGKNNGPLENVLAKASLFGAGIKVESSKSAGFEGVCGIIIDETKNTLVIIDQKDKVRVVPKAGCNFSLSVGSQQMVIPGVFWGARALS